MIGRCCKGKVSSADGLHFRYKGVPYIKRKILKNRYFCETTLKNGNVVRERNVRKFCINTGISYASLSGLLGGYRRRMAETFYNTIYVTDTYGKNMRIENGYLIT